jgi:hypothetical protein
MARRDDLPPAAKPPTLDYAEREAERAGDTGTYMRAMYMKGPREYIPQREAVGFLSAQDRERQRFGGKRGRKRSR